MRITTLFLILMAVPAVAQEAARFLRLDFVIREFEDNKPVSAKTYSAMTTTDERSRGVSIRTGNKVPYQAGPNSWNYTDVGVNIDAQKTVVEANGQITVTLVADITTMPAPSESVNPMLPHIRQNRWNGVVTLVPGKATLLYSSDDLNSKRKLQVELTATPVK
jgi:hypothetical protein